VLVSLDGPRVIDCGVARAAERIQLTVTRGAVGTPAYMAPEQARDSRQATVASDVFSLGATTLFAATGHGPERDAAGFTWPSGPPRRPRSCSAPVRRSALPVGLVLSASPRPCTPGRSRLPGRRELA
jgi:serine/threonine protein kinase